MHVLFVKQMNVLKHGPKVFRWGRVHGSLGKTKHIIQAEARSAKERAAVAAAAVAGPWLPPGPWPGRLVGAESGPETSSQTNKHVHVLGFNTVCTSSHSGSSTYVYSVEDKKHTRGRPAGRQCHC